LDVTIRKRGVTEATKVAWRSGAARDKVFELIGDYNEDDHVNNADDLAWDVYEGSTGSNLPADGDDDGDVDLDDRDLTEYYFGTSLDLSDVLLV
jgi:hypothetical protein